MALPSLDDLVTGLEHRLGVEVGSLEDEDRLRAEAALSDASALVSSVVGITVIGDADADAPSLAVTVVYAAAKRAYLNPSGAEQESVGGISVRWGSAWLTAEERTSLGNLRGTGGLWTLSTTRREGTDSTIYVPTAPEPAGYPFPWYADDTYL